MARPSRKLVSRRAAAAQERTNGGALVEAKTPQQRYLAALETLVGKQRPFVERFLVHFNGTKAALEAGYAEKSARFIASQNLTKPNIIAAIRAGAEALTERAEIEAEDLLRRIDLIATAQVADVMKAGPEGEPIMRDFDEIDERGWAGLSGMEVTRRRIANSEAVTIKYKFKMHPVIPAAVTALKRRGLLTDPKDPHEREAELLRAAMTEMLHDYRPSPAELRTIDAELDREV